MKDYIQEAKEITNDNKLICPVMSAGNGNFVYCQEDKCAWYVRNIIDNSGKCKAKYS